MQKKRFEVLKVAYKEPIHVMKFALRIYDCAMHQTKEYTFLPRDLPFHFAICALLFCISRQPHRSQAVHILHTVCFAANKRASSSRSLPQNISVPTKKVGAPKMPLARACSVWSRSRFLIGSD